MKQEYYKITREIGIDAGHRVPSHGSKCRNPHGHRYRVLATCRGPLVASGSEQGMVADFSFLNELMMKEIDEPCDHGVIAWIQDAEWLSEMIHPAILKKIIAGWDGNWSLYSLPPNPAREYSISKKVYIIPEVPTVENLTRHWYRRLGPVIRERTDGQVELMEILAYETPNCFARYSNGAVWRNL